jgi:hypothetical protein
VKISLPQGKVLNGTFYISRWTGCRRKAPPKERLPKTASERMLLLFPFYCRHLPLKFVGRVA